jgi:hypothetical protein
MQQAPIIYIQQFLRFFRLVLFLVTAFAAPFAPHAANGLSPQQEPLDFWEWRHPLPQGNDLTDVIFAAGKFLAVGDYASVVQTADAAHFTLHSLESPLNLGLVAYGNGEFVALARGADFPFNRVSLTSSDGLAWAVHPQPILTDRFPQGLAFGKGVFVLVGDPSPNGNPTIFTSPDGVTWTDRGYPEQVYLSDLIFANDLFVAVGRLSSGLPAILTSPDGVIWTSRHAGDPATLSRVAYGNGIFTAIGVVQATNAVSLTSTDGIAWNRSSFEGPAIAFPADLAFGNGQFVSLWKGNTPAIFLTSPDGVTWTRQSTSADNLKLRALAFGDGKFLAAGGQGNLAASVDGTRWQPLSSAIQDNLRGITYADGQFVAVGNAGMNAISQNGLLWTWQPPASTQNLHHVTFGGGMFVAVGAAGTILTSSDGRAWVPRESGSKEDLFEVAYHDGLFVTVGGHFAGLPESTVFFHTILTSPDGSNWDAALTGSGFRLHGVTCANGLFIAVGQPGKVLVSTNGLDWQSHTAGFQYLKSVTYGNGLYVAVGEGGATAIATSTNALDWTTIDSRIPSNELDEVLFANGQFVATGDDGLIITSADGLAWVQRHSPTATNLRGVGFGEGAFIIVGNNQIILQSGLSGPPTISIVQRSSVNLELALRGQIGQSYQLQSSTDLRNWISIYNFAASTPTVDFVESNVTNSKAYYRLISP